MAPSSVSSIHSHERPFAALVAPEACCSIVEFEFDELYYQIAKDLVRQLEQDHLGGRRHVFERHLKQRRRTPGEPGHEMNPGY